MKMQFGCIYKRRYDSHNEQHYYVYIPVILKDKKGELHYRMVDAYVISNPCYADKSYEKHIWFLEQANQGETSWKIYYDVCNYYYQNYVDLTSDELNESEWKVIADLHEYKTIRPEEVSEYLDKDVITNVPIWNEDGYSWNNGACYYCNYVKKDAKKDGTRVFNTAKCKYYLAFTYDSNLDDLERICKECLTMKLERGYKTKIIKKLKEIRKYRELVKEFEDFKNKLYRKKKKTGRIKEE